MRSNDQRVGEVLRSVVKGLRGGGKLAEAEIRTLWPETMGALVARHTTQLVLRGGSLQVRVDSAPLRQELLYNRTQVIERLNDRLREPIIAELIVR